MMSLPVIEGVSAGHAAAGFGGALASLPFMPPGSKWTILLSLGAGLATAMFLTPIVAEALAHQKLLGFTLSVKGELGLAFILGLTSMVLLPAIIGVVSYVRDNVSRIMDRIAGLPPKTEVKAPDDKGVK